MKFNVNTCIHCTCVDISTFKMPKYYHAYESGQL